MWRRNVERTSKLMPASLLVVVSSLMGFSACLDDIIMTCLLGTWYPGHNPLSQPMSDLERSGNRSGIADHER